MKIESAAARLGQDTLPRLGLVALATDLTSETDARRVITPDEAAIHVARIPFENPTTPAQLRRMGPDLATAAGLLIPGVELSAISFACTSASVTIRNDVVMASIGEARPGVPVVTPSAAALAALGALGVDRIAMLTPYLPETTAPMVAYFEDEGITVTRAAGFDLADDRDMARLTPDALIDAARAIDTPDAQALFLSCTALPALGVIERLEQLLEKPVISSNQASLWALRHLAGLSRQPTGFGRVFGCTPPAGAFRSA